MKVAENYQRTGVRGSTQDLIPADVLYRQATTQRVTTTSGFPDQACRNLQDRDAAHLVNIVRCS